MATVLITGASSGFGALTAQALKDVGHTVYAGMRNASSRPEAVAAREHGLLPVQASVFAVPLADGCADVVVPREDLQHV